MKTPKYPIRHKFRAIPTERDGFKFQSKKEARRYDDLKLLQANGEVVFFIRQTPFHLPGNITYSCDFLVFWSDGEVTVEDVKGHRTPAFIRNKKMVETLYPVKILEV